MLLNKISKKVIVLLLISLLFVVPIYAEFNIPQEIDLNSYTPGGIISNPSKLSLMQLNNLPELSFEKPGVGKIIFDEGLNFSNLAMNPSELQALGTSLVINYDNLDTVFNFGVDTTILSIFRGHGATIIGTNIKEKFNVPGITPENWKEYISIEVLDNANIPIDSEELLDYIDLEHSSYSDSNGGTITLRVNHFTTYNITPKNGDEESFEKWNVSGENVVSTDKIWTIEFNKEISDEIVLNEYIYVKDSNSNIITQEVIKDSNSSNKILVYPPIEEYESSGEYNLYILKEILAKDESILSSSIYMTFTIE